MRQPLRSLAFLPLAALFVGCGAGQLGADGSDIDAVSSAENTGFASTYRSMYLRGTMNDWKKTAMTLVADHQWQAEAAFPAGAGAFKFDAYGNWKKNFGDDDGDQIADEKGGNIAVEGGKTYVIAFNDESRFYFVQEKTWAATVSLALPAGADASAFQGQQATVAKDGEQGWSVGLYVDSDHGVPYCPLSSLSLGAGYTFRLDLIVGGTRYVAEKHFTVDGSADELAVSADVSVGSLAGYGTVSLTVLSDRYEGGALASSPWGEMDVFLGAWQAGQRLGRTTGAGTLELTLPAGEQTLSAFTMTSSHSVASASTTVEVRAGEKVSAEIHVAWLTVVLRAHYDCGSGNALYLTGASSYLGDWSTAQKMGYDPTRGLWTWQGNLPLGLPFKIVRGPWVDGESIATSQVTWELGDNHTVTPPVGYYQTELDLYPTF